MKRTWMGTMVLAALLSAGMFARAEEAPDQGVIEGTSLSWPTGRTIEVWPDGGGEPMKLRPRWIGGAPKDGGHLDEAIAEQLKAVAEGSRVRIEWVAEEGPRVVGVKVLEPADTEGGTVEGTVIATQRNALILSVGEPGRAMRVMPQWLGGTPKDGGHLDEATLEQVRDTPVGSTVRVEWIYSERPRIKAMEILKRGEEPTDDADRERASEQAE